MSAAMTSPPQPRAGAGMSPAATLVREALGELIADPMSVRVLVEALHSAGVPIGAATDGDPWLDARAAAAHVGVSLDSFKKVWDRIPYAQEAPGCKRFWRRSDLDAYRLAGRVEASTTLP